MRSVLLGAVSGLVLVLAYPPTGAGWVAVPAIALFLWSIRAAGRRGAAWAAGAGFGLTFFTFLFPWIGELGVIALIPLVISQAVFPFVYARWAWSLPTDDAQRWVAMVAAGWGVMEFVRARFPFGGFPWGMAGYPVGEYDPLRDAAQWIGTSGWSVVVVALAATLVVAVDRRRLEPWMAVAPGVVLALGLAGAVAAVSTDGAEIRTVIVQGSSPCPAQRCSGERRGTYEASLELMRSIPAGAADLVVWPEGSTGFDVDPVLDPAIGDAISAEAARIGAVTLVGGDRPVSDTEWINANVVWTGDGELVGEYQKRHPVPFGEYVPARPLFDWIPDLSRVPRDMIRGDGPVLFDLDGEEFGSVISFESSFARYSRDTVREGARLIVVATSQSSYPFSNASDQLIGMTRMRSAELGVDVVHGSVTGRSTIITDGGDVGERTGLAEITSIAGVVQFRDDGLTMYAALGDWVQYLAIAWVLVPVVRRRSVS